MSLRKSPTLTPALLASNRLNAKKSTGPRTARGKAWSRLNGLKDGRNSRECLDLLMALMYAPPGRMGEIVQLILASKPAIHAVFNDIALIALKADLTICQQLDWIRAQRNRK
jgi:hypothetical protein